MAEFTVGIVGGLGPETSAKFYASVADGVYQRTGTQPNMIMDNVPISTADLDIISKGRSEKVFSLLDRSIKRLSGIPVDLIAIPCNTVHVYFERLQAQTPLRILNIIDETVAEVKSLGVKKAGILATTTTIESRMYQEALGKAGIGVVLPSGSAQERVASTVMRILSGTNDESDKMFLNRVADTMAKQGAEGVILGCTDLQLLLNSHEQVALVDSMESLAKATVARILGRL